MLIRATPGGDYRAILEDWIGDSRAERRTDDSHSCPKAVCTGIAAGIPYGPTNINYGGGTPRRVAVDFPTSFIAADELIAVAADGVGLCIGSTLGHDARESA